MVAAGGAISSVHPDSIGAEIGLEPGDRLLSINGHALRDQVDFQYYGAEEELALVVERAGQRHRISVERDYDEDLGIEFAEPVFGGLRLCTNRCPFCFVQQMPKGMRRSLYVHDDDYRYSFLLGNFVTLTNLTEEDWQRIGEQRLSPLFVSIHATDLDVRRQLLGKPDAPDILEQLSRLSRAGIVVHGQIVIVPGINDGDVLRCSIADLAGLWPTVQTLALVPVGLTRFHRGDIHNLDGEDARRALDTVAEFSPLIRQRFDSTWLYPSDELYLLAGAPLPDAAFYDDSAHLENGVGMVRGLLDDWAEAREGLTRGDLTGRCITLVCGTLIAPILSEPVAALAEETGLWVDLVPVTNRFFGETVTVSGLLTGGDVLAVLSGRELGEIVFLPRAMFDADGERTLDDLGLDSLSEELGVPVALVSTMSEVLGSL